MIKSIVLALVTGATALGAANAHAGGVSWSVGIHTPVVGTVISNRPAYYEPAYYAPDYGAYAPVYAPAPVYRVVPPPVAYYPAPVVYHRPVPVLYPRYYHGYARHPGWRHGHGHRHWHGGHGGHH